MSRREAFDFLCGVLSLDESPELNDRLRQMLRSGLAPWPDVVAIASDQWVSAAVWPAMRRKSLQDDRSRDAIDYFEGMATLNRQRNASLRVEAVDITRILNNLDVTPIFLKGAANLLANLYPDQAIRMMLDLDVLVPPGRVSECAEALLTAGYVQLDDIGFPEHHHFSPLGRPDAAAAIELHVDPLDIQFQRLLSYADASDHAVTMTIDGARLAVPAPWCRLVHGIAHAQFADHAFAYGRLPLRDLLDTALLCQSGTVDWDAVAARFSGRWAGTILAFHLAATQRLFGARVPAKLASTRLEGILFRRALVQVEHPSLPSRTESLLRPLLLLRRYLSHTLLRRRLTRNLRDPAWYGRQWRMIRQIGR